MPERRLYYISLDKRTISEVSVPDTTEYEVMITNDELQYFQNLLKESEKHDFWFATKNITVAPFNEQEVDQMREEDDDILMTIYQFLYDHGTEETKRKLTEVGFKSQTEF